MKKLWSLSPWHPSKTQFHLDLSSDPRDEAAMQEVWKGVVLIRVFQDYERQNPSWLGRFPPRPMAGAVSTPAMTRFRLHPIDFYFTQATSGTKAWAVSTRPLMVKAISQKN
jgi:hypothetical protein